MLMGDLSYEEALNMARLMKATGDQVRERIRECLEAQHGVVEMRFTNQCTEVEVVISDEPYDGDVRIYPHWGEDE